MEDVQNIKKVEYRIDGGDWIDTGVAAKSHSGYSLSIQSLSEGQHTVEVRGTDVLGNIGETEYATFKIDRSGPKGQTLFSDLTDWNNKEAVSIRWSGMTDACGIKKTEYQVDSGDWTDTGIAAGACAAYSISTSRLSDGIHTVRLRGTDVLGNIGPSAEVKIKIDRSSPDKAELSVMPDQWSNQEEAVISWSGINDAFSGIGKVEYRVVLQEKTDDAEPSSGHPVTGWTEIADAKETGNLAFDISDYKDGIYSVELRSLDKAGNISEVASGSFYRDTKAPDVLILEPAESALLDGMTEIKGSAEDLHLISWKLTAQDSSGNEVEVASWEKETSSAGDAKEETFLGSLDLGQYPDGENVMLILTAADAAGNTASTARTVIRVSGEMEKLEPTISLSFPKKMTNPQERGMYSGFTESKAGELSVDGSAVLYIDGQPQEEVNGDSFLIDAVRYEKGSVHTVSILGETGGTLACSSGIGTVQLLDEL